MKTKGATRITLGTVAAFLDRMSARMAGDSGRATEMQEKYGPARQDGTQAEAVIDPADCTK